MSSSPAFFWIPPGSSFKMADAAGKIATSLGYMVDDEERQALRALLGQRPDGRWATLETAIVCGRQNIKTWAVQMAILTECLVRPDGKRIVWSAHLYKTTQDTFNEFVNLIERNDWLDSEVAKITRGNGEEGIVWKSGLQLDFVARSIKAARGLAGDTVVFDEALFLTPQMLGALLPTLSSRPNPHAIFASSPGLKTSEQLRRIRDRGRAGDDPSLSYIEWTSERQPCATPDCEHRLDAKGCLLDDEARWMDANPALGRRISLEYVRSERRSLEPVEFMRERMGWWDDPLTASELSLYPLDDWTECLDETVRHRDGAQLVLAVDVSWNRTLAAISVAEVLPDGLRLVEQLAQVEPQDVRQLLASKYIPNLRPMAIAVQANGAPASTLVQDLEALGVPLHALHGGDMAKAAGHLVDAMRTQTIRHCGRDDQAELSQAVATAISRPLGDGWAIDRKKSPTNVASLVAVSEALWVLDSLVGSADYDLAASVH